MVHWAEQYLAKGYEHGATGPDRFDCWGLARDVQQAHYGRELPTLDVLAITAADVRQVLRGWRRTHRPVDGDGVVMGSKSEPHVGVWLDVDGGRVLHITSGDWVRASSIEQLAMMGFSRLRFYHPREACDA